MSKCAGYLLLEVALVVTLIIVLVGIGLPHMTLLQQRMINYELAVMRQFFTAVAQRAMATGEPQTIILDTNAQSYACGGFVQHLAKGVVFGVGSVVTSTPSEDGNPLMATTFNHNQIICYPNGSVQSGTLYLTNTQRSVCGSLTIPVGSYLHIRTYRYTNGRWKRIE